MRSDHPLLLSVWINAYEQGIDCVDVLAGLSILTDQEGDNLYSRITMHDTQGFFNAIEHMIHQRMLKIQSLKQRIQIKKIHLDEAIDTLYTNTGLGDKP